MIKRLVLFIALIMLWLLATGFDMPEEAFINYINFSISIDGETVDVPVSNIMITGNVRVIKTGNGGVPLSGVVFGVFNSVGGLVEELTTSADGTGTSTALSYGNYELRELSTINGYELLQYPIPLTISENGVIVDVPVSNSRIIGKMFA